MKPLVSIGIPCFNSARWLQQAIESALGQTWAEKEIIVVDDGSTDASAELARQYGERVRLIVTESRGGNHARNCALRAARGEWLQFLDADDYLQPEKIERQLGETADGAKADVLYSPTWIEDLARGSREASVIDSGFDLYGQWLAWQIPQTGGALWRRSALAALGGWKEGQPCCQEHELYLRALQGGLRFQYAPTPHAVYRIWSELTVCRRDPRRVIQVRTELMDELIAWLRARRLWTPAHERTAGQAFFEMARTLAQHDVTQAATYFRERRERGLIHLAGPAAPRSYLLAHRLLGFTGAEKLAAIRR